MSIHSVYFKVTIQKVFYSTEIGTGDGPVRFKSIDKVYLSITEKGLNGIVMTFMHLSVKCMGHYSDDLFITLDKNDSGY